MEQREFYVQVRDTLIEHKLKFSKALLKKFVQWIFVEFPNTSLDEARSLPFWEKIKGRMIFLQGCGDTSVEHFFTLLTLTHSVAKRPKKKAKVNTPVTPSPLPVPRLPHFPKPLQKSRGPRAQGCHQLPGTPCASPSPARKGLAQSSPSAPKRASPNPLFPIVSPKVNSPSLFSSWCSPK